MTDNEVFKALECCAKDSSHCPECPLHNVGNQCRADLTEYTFDYVKRLKAENEGLKISVEVLSRKVAKARNGTVDEFAERFTRSISGCFHCVNMKIIRAKINTVAEQMKK